MCVFWCLHQLMFQLWIFIFHHCIFFFAFCFFLIFQNLLHLTDRFNVSLLTPFDWKLARGSVLMNLVSLILGIIFGGDQPAFFLMKPCCLLLNRYPWYIFLLASVRSISRVYGLCSRVLLFRRWCYHQFLWFFSIFFSSDGVSWSQFEIV